MMWGGINSVGVPDAPEVAAPEGLEPAAADAAGGGESLDALAREADFLDLAPAAESLAAQAAQAQATDSNQAELLATATLLRALVLPVLPAKKSAALALVWSDDVLSSASAAGAAVLDLHGISMGQTLGRYGPYIALIAALAPPTLATLNVIREPDEKPATLQGGPSVGQLQPA